MMNKINDKLYSWASDIDQGTILQAEKTARLPIVRGHVALMPDAHVGMGATVGSVIPTEGAVIPSAVGVDIGCGMVATETSLVASDLPDDLSDYLGVMEHVIPAGVGKAHEYSSRHAETWMSKNKPHSVLDGKQQKTAITQFGTLGSGNHFAEVCLDEREHVWLVLHSGSRGIGNQLAQGHIKHARRLAKNLQLKLEDPDLAYFLEGTDEFNHYIDDMLWAQDYAMANRQSMNMAFASSFFGFVGAGKVVDTINCHHNFTQREFFPSDTGSLSATWVTRKGAIKADRGDRGVIPGSMGTKSYIVEGRGNHMSWNSCSHGAGRRMSRGEAKRTFTTDDLSKLMEGKVWLEAKAQSLLDEIPTSYKDIDQVMADQKDLVTVKHTLGQILNFKGA